MESNIYCPCIVINRLHVAMSCYEAIKRLRQICRCYMAKSEFPRFADVQFTTIKYFTVQMLQCILAAIGLDKKNLFPLNHYQSALNVKC